MVSLKVEPPFRSRSAPEATAYQNRIAAPFSKGGAATAAGIWRQKAWGPKFAKQTLGISSGAKRR